MPVRNSWLRILPVERERSTSFALSAHRYADDALPAARQNKTGGFSIGSVNGNCSVLRQIFQLFQGLRRLQRVVVDIAGTHVHSLLERILRDSHQKFLELLLQWHKQPC